MCSGCPEQVAGGGGTAQKFALHRGMAGSSQVVKRSMCIFLLASHAPVAFSFFASHGSLSIAFEICLSRAIMQEAAAQQVPSIQRLEFLVLTSEVQSVGLYSRSLLDARCLPGQAARRWPMELLARMPQAPAKAAARCMFTYVLEGVSSFVLFAIV